MAKTLKTIQTAPAQEFKFRVTVKVAGKPDHTVEVMAPREGLAQTMAMMRYPHKLCGDLVQYDVVRV